MQWEYQATVQRFPAKNLFEKSHVPELLNWGRERCHSALGKCENKPASEGQACLVRTHRLPLFVLGTEETSFHTSFAAHCSHSVK